MRRAFGIAAATALALGSAVPAIAQSLASRIDAVRDGSVEFTFATRPGVCGDGHGSVWMHANRETYSTSRNERNCIPGPDRVTIGKADGQIVSVRSCVACRSRDFGAGDVDLGERQGSEAAHYLVRLAKTLGGRSASDAVAAASFADGVDISDDLVALIRDDDATLEGRKDALFWLGQSDSPTQQLVRLDPALHGRQLRGQYTFVLSQRHDDDAAFDKLMDIAQHDPDFDIRKQALFWLGQSKNPRAVKFFQSILTR